MDTPGDHSDRVIGQVFNDTYKIIGKIAAGGMGAVYEAQHLRLPDKRFAVKMLLPSAAEARHAEAMARFQQEAKVASKLGHPNIVEVIDFNHLEDGSPYIVMPFLQGQDLKAHLDEVGRLDQDELLQIVREIGAALQRAHEQGIVHRDMKPKNIFLEQHGEGSFTAKILDFGISKIRDNVEALTSTNSVLGTVHYMSPEQARGGSEEIEGTTDIFALGTIIYQAISGELPFVGPNTPAVMFKICHEEPTPLANLVQGLPPNVPGVVQRALAKIKSERFQTADELVKALTDAYSGAEQSLPSDGGGLPDSGSSSDVDSGPSLKRISGLNWGNRAEANVAGGRSESRERAASPEDISAASSPIEQADREPKQDPPGGVTGRAGRVSTEAAEGQRHGIRSETHGRAGPPGATESSGALRRFKATNEIPADNVSSARDEAEGSGKNASLEVNRAPDGAIAPPRKSGGTGRVAPHRSGTKNRTRREQQPIRRLQKGRDGLIATIGRDRGKHREDSASRAGKSSESPGAVPDTTRSFSVGERVSPENAPADQTGRQRAGTSSGRGPMLILGLFVAVGLTAAGVVLVQEYSPTPESGAGQAGMTSEDTGKSLPQESSGIKNDNAKAKLKFSITPRRSTLVAIKFKQDGNTLERAQVIKIEKLNPFPLDNGGTYEFVANAEDGGYKELRLTRTLSGDLRLHFQLVPIKDRITFNLEPAGASVYYKRAKGSSWKKVPNPGSGYSLAINKSYHFKAEFGAGTDSEMVSDVVKWKFPDDGRAVTLKCNCSKSVPSETAAEF